MKTKSKRKLIPAFIRNVISFINRNIRTSLRLQLIVIFIVCILVSIIAVVITGELLNNNRPMQSYISYQDGIDNIERTASFIERGFQFELDDNLDHQGLSLLQIIQQYITEQEEIKKYKIMLIDPNGVVIAKSSNVLEKNVDIQLFMFNTINKLIENRNDHYNTRQEYTTLRPILLNDLPHYLVVQGIPEANQVFYYSNNDGPLPFIIGIIVFFMLFYNLTKRKMRIIEKVADGLLEISKGNSLTDI